MQGRPDFDRVRASQIGWVRLTIRWSDINPAPGVWELGELDREVADARAHGVDVLALLSHTPEWAGGGAHGVVPPADLGPWRELVGRVARRYRGRIAAYEIWNEPDVEDKGDGIGWDRDLDVAPRYVDLLHAAATIIRDEAPGTVIVAPALSSASTERTAQLWRQLESTAFADGAALDDVDVVSVHQNVLDADPPGEWLVRLLSRKLYPLSAEAPVLAKKPLWLTEFGWQSAQVRDARQREYLEQALTLATGAADWPRCDNVANYRITAAFIYKLQDSGGETSGIFRESGEAKPAVAEFLQPLAFPATAGGTQRADLAVDCADLDCTFRQATFDPAGPWRCAWDFGDGTGAEGCAASHAYHRRGQYLVGLSMQLATLRLDGSRWLAATCADRQPPTVVVRSPAPGARVDGVVAVRAHATDDRGVVETQLWVDGRLLATRPRGGTVGFLWDTRELRPGSTHLLRIVARDRCGNLGSSTNGTIAVIIGGGSEPPSRLRSAARPRARRAARVFFVAEAISEVRKARDEPGAAPDFSPLAATYVRVRPTYPPALYAWLAGLARRHELAWDCATGNGQAALGLAPHFARVVATDRSAEQLRHAPPHPRVEYRLATAERSGLAARRADLVTVAAALHWLDFAAFFAETARVLCPGGVLAAWTYHTAICEPPFDRAFHRLYWDVLRPYFDDRVRYVDDRYAGIAMPGEPIAAPPFTLTVDWTLEDALDYVRTWSGANVYREKTGADPAELIREELAPLFGDAATTRTVRIPLFVRASRLD
ncbi:MAG TPA: methyltransferase domain-containing protein [Thermoanaerobaculia bacterium]|nr:methyltransferase domain-containing protein [Thermoanaerobaculia bacterium]